MLKTKFRAIIIALASGTMLAMSANARPAENATQQATKTFKITKQYLNFPITHSLDRKKMTIVVKGVHECTSEVRLAPKETDYWTFEDVSAWRGKTLTITYDGAQEALDRVYQADTIMNGSQIYHESSRPQYHFTTRRGWINDPNGLIYYKGKYHMFYQHNPYERDWGNMHWAHAVSTDMLHWQELPLALHPDTVGVAFSGSAVVDSANTAGFQKKKSAEPALVFPYTSTTSVNRQRQSLAYSLDGAQTFHKYAGNPIIDSFKRWQTNETRDPKVFWYAPGKHWVMALYECDGITIYNSTDLKNWTPVSHTAGYWECPELFQLPVDGNKNNMKWVMWGASGTYMIGSFDGKRFVPETSKLCNLQGSAYAAQTYAGTGDRVIKMAWGIIGFDGQPFTGCMLLPQEQSLRTERDGGIRLYSTPVKEVESLFTTVYEGTDIKVEDANKVLERYADNDCLHVRARIRLLLPTSCAMHYRGRQIMLYDLNHNRLNGEFYATEEPGSMTLDVDLYMDHGMYEMYFDGGRFSTSAKREDLKGNKSGYMIYGPVKIESLQVQLAKSVWQ